jgi:hypothetical protein
MRIEHLEIFSLLAGICKRLIFRQDQSFLPGHTYLYLDNNKIGIIAEGKTMVVGIVLTHPHTWLRIERAKRGRNRSFCRSMARTMAGGPPNPDRETRDVLHLTR